MKNTNQQANYEDMSSSLEYKDHRIFFEKFYELNYEVVTLIYDAGFVDKKKFSDLKGKLMSLINWGSPYLSLKIDVTQLIKEVINTSDFYKLVDIYHQITKVFEQTELMPKNRLSGDDDRIKFWKNEGEASMREMKKAFYDTFVLNNQ